MVWFTVSDKGNAILALAKKSAASSRDLKYPT
jgi:hypothetical protein